MVAAPGKVFLVGEYGVLDGGTAVLAAVNRVAVGEFIPELDAGSPLVDAGGARRRWRRWATRAARCRPARSGSTPARSPPTAMATTMAACASSGSARAPRPPRAPSARCWRWRACRSPRIAIWRSRSPSRRIAPGRAALGSGADVAAAVYGGVLQFTRPGGGAPVVRASAGGLGALQLVVFSSRTAVSTDEPDPHACARSPSASPRRYAGAAGAGARGRRALRRVAGVAQRARDDRRDCARRAMALAALGDAAERPDRDAALRARGRASPPTSAARPSPRAPAAATSASRCSPIRAGGAGVHRTRRGSRGDVADSRRRGPANPGFEDRRERPSSPDRRHRETGAPCLSKVHESLAFTD